MEPHFPYPAGLLSPCALTSSGLTKVAAQARSWRWLADPVPCRATCPQTSCSALALQVSLGKQGQAPGPTLVPCSEAHGSHTGECFGAAPSRLARRRLLA